MTTTAPIRRGDPVCRGSTARSPTSPGSELALNFKRSSGDVVASGGPFTRVYYVGIAAAPSGPWTTRSPRRRSTATFAPSSRCANAATVLPNA